MPDAVSAKIQSLDDRRGDLPTRVRQVIISSVPDVIEEVKWRESTNPLGVPTWSHAGIICTGESYKAQIKLTFPKGSLLSDPYHYFNVGTGIRPSVDILENKKLDESALRHLVREAAALNAVTKKTSY